MQNLNKADGETVVQVPVERIRSDEGQARKTFDDAQLDELVASVRQVGILEPIELRSDDERRGHYVIVYGERRWRAARVAGLAIVPAFLNRDPGRVRRRQLYENVVRVDLNVVELAANVAAVMAEDKLDNKALAEQLHWPLRKVQRLVEIHEAPDAVKHAIVRGIDVEGTRRTLSVSHALDVVRAFRHYARADDTATEQEATARLDRLIARVLKEEWSAGKLQQYVGALGRSPKRDPLDRTEKDVAPKAAPAETTAGMAAGCATPAADSPAATLLPLFEAKADRFTVFVKRARETEDPAARSALAEALSAIAREFTS